MADQHDLAAIELGQTADDRLVFAIETVTAQRHELGKAEREVVHEVGALRMARHLRLLPGRELGVRAAQQRRALLFQPADLGSDVEIAAAGGGAQFGNARFQFRDRLFEFKKRDHALSVQVCCRAPQEARFASHSSSHLMV